jgi:hypothetical protein
MKFWIIVAGCAILAGVCGFYIPNPFLSFLQGCAWGAFAIWLDSVTG